MARVSILFFGATAAVTGRRRLEIHTSAGASAADAFDRVIAEYPGLASHQLLLSLNESYATGHEALNDGDELAVFTAVSGG